MCLVRLFAFLKNVFNFARIYLIYLNRQFCYDYFSVFWRYYFTLFWSLMILLRTLVVDFIFYNILNLSSIAIETFVVLQIQHNMLTCRFIFCFPIQDLWSFFNMRIHVAYQIEKFLVLISLNIAQSLVSLLLSEILLALLFYFSYISYSYK